MAGFPRQRVAGKGIPRRQTTFRETSQRYLSGAVLAPPAAREPAAALNEAAKAVGDGLNELEWPSHPHSTRYGPPFDFGISTRNLDRTTATHAKHGSRPRSGNLSRRLIR